MLFLLTWLRPTFDALNPFNKVPFFLRWRLLLCQPIFILIYTIKCLPWLFSRRYTVLHIPNRHGNKLRCIVFQPTTRHKSPQDQSANTTTLKPLHIHLHGGGWLGGSPDCDAGFCSLLADRTGAVVIAPSYRFAPIHAFPAAADDVDDVADWLRAHATDELGADPRLMSVSGFSAGGNLAMAVAQKKQRGEQPEGDDGAEEDEEEEREEGTDVKASVTFYAVVDLRTPPSLKPKPPGYPQTNPLAWLNPLLDAYAAPVREARIADTRLSPILADLRSLPERMLFVVPTADILLDEQVKFVERLKREGKEEQEGREREGGGGGGVAERRVESLLAEGQLHGWVETPWPFVDEKSRDEAFGATFEFIKDMHRNYGFN